MTATLGLLSYASSQRLANGPTFTSTGYYPEGGGGGMSSLYTGYSNVEALHAYHSVPSSPPFSGSPVSSVHFATSKTLPQPRTHDLEFLGMSLCAPSPEAVPVPRFALTLRRTIAWDTDGRTTYLAQPNASNYSPVKPPRSKVYRLWKDKSNELQLFLREAATIAMSMPDWEISMTSLGRGLSSESIEWLQGEHLRMVDVFRWFAKDFAMWEEAGRLQVGYLRANLKTSCSGL
eukprot:TRINITY_DN35719_c0_g1_i2.p1 TRINITY_DN35719_c0_g1~~TRINITY_DN35719_c0_g1_i2.p1  ORF type:complete len:233 (+),score=29.51 TRINITY_DN35719_c0_g1_i2:123-821(+)